MLSTSQTSPNVFRLCALIAFGVPLFLGMLEYFGPPNAEAGPKAAPPKIHLSAHNSAELMDSGDTGEIDEPIKPTAVAAPKPPPNKPAAPAVVHSASSTERRREDEIVDHLEKTGEINLMPEATLECAVGKYVDHHDFSFEDAISNCLE